ncbi:hypothetical protein RBH94_13485 [Aestuariibaculum sp. YM273]|uniref:hypothetical protein n=1 Tax=Aestuariibaculum sp. YM273 TaxID=3070659 RepID=UPI0027DB9575|nr:hypothetical protein [Aestuariibaculum sp. YM273]WMI65065.1 hypothetical protein RBH94_13485 [Aestuariibaculum sp. YM273]
MKESTVSDDYPLTRFIRYVNLVGVLLFATGIFIPNSSIKYISMLFFVYFYFWIFILFLASEIGFVIVNKSNLFKHIQSSWWVALGVLFPITLFVILSAMMVLQ